MFGHLDTTTLMIMGLAIASGAFFAGVAMDGIMGRDGFGTIGNMAILLSGALVGMYVGDLFQWSIDRAVAQTVAAVGGGFSALALLAILKSLMIRMGF